MTRSKWHVVGKAWKWHLFFVAGALWSTLIAAAGSRLRAAELAEQAHSLRTVPRDAAFYSANMRLKEQLDIFLGSNAYRKLMEVPIVQMAKMQIEFQWQQSSQPAVARVREYFDSAEGQESLALLKQMFAKETFSYAGADVVGLVKLLMEFNNLTRTARLEALATGETEQEVLSRKVIDMLDQHAEEFVVPDVVWGFRIDDAQRAGKQLDRVQELLKNMLDEHHPELAAKLQRESIAGNDFLTLRLDGTMIPWDELRDEAENLSDEQFAKLRTLLNKKTMVVAVGVIGEFVVVTVGDSTEHLTKLGSGPTLAEQPIVKRLEKHAGERLTSIGYLSAALAKSLSSPRQTIDDVIASIDQSLQQLEIADELRGQLVRDVKGLGDDLVKYMPEPGDLAGVSYLTARGYESYQYQTGTRPFSDSSQPLTVTEHVGGKPLLMVAARQKQSVESYDETVGWIQRVAAQVELVVKERTDPDDWAKYLELREKGLPLLERWNRATREHLMPALADGQQALVLDVAAKSKRWFRKMPESPYPLPMLELGFVANVSNLDQLRQAIAAYFDIIRDAIAVLHEMHPEEMPEITLPRPEKRELADGGAMYTYALPADWEVDGQLALNGAATSSVAAVSLTPAFTERMLRTMPLAVETSLDLHRPAAMISSFEIARLIDAIRPWIDYGGGIATGQIKAHDDEDDDEQSPEQAQALMTAGMFLPQIHQLLDVATAMRNFTCVVYFEEEAWVSHSELHLKDLK